MRREQESSDAGKYRNGARSVSEGRKQNPHYHDNDHIPIPPVFFPNHPMPHHTTTIHPGRHVYDEDMGDLEAKRRLSFPVVEAEEEKDIEITTLHDLIAGGIAGSASVFVGQPFDTIKVRMQAGAASATVPELSLASARSLFNGMLAPLAAAGFVNALVFSSYGYSSRLWDDYFAITEEQKEDEDTKSGFKMKNYVCGAFAGFAQTFVLCPIEHLKCRLQTQESAAGTLGSTKFRGPSDVALQIYRTHGVPGVFRGWTATAWREIPAFGLYFATYDMIKEYITRELYKDAPAVADEGPSWIASAIAGGISGCITWTVVYPMDVIKTRIQTRPLDCKQGIAKVGTDIIRKHGWKFMFRGLGVTLVRAFPVNGIIFPVYEFSLLHLPGMI